VLNSCLLILAGGFGTRLRSVVFDRPKPLAPVGGIPFLQFLLEQWKAQGIRNYVFLLHHQAEQVVAWLHTLEATLLDSCTYSVVIEPQPLNTGGAVAYAVQQLALQGDFLVANADTWLGTGVSSIKLTTPPALSVIRVDDTSRYGSVLFNNIGNVTAFNEKQDSIGTGWINAGLYHLMSDDFSDWEGQPFSLEQDWFPTLVRTGRLKAVPLQTTFIDIGIPEDYQRFKQWIESGKSFIL